MVYGYRKNELLTKLRSSFEQNLEIKCYLADELGRQLEQGTVNGTVYPHPDLSDILLETCLAQIPAIEAYYVQF